MSQMRLPKIKDPLGDLNLPDLSIIPEIILEEEEISEEDEPISSKDVFGNKFGEKIKQKNVKITKKDEIRNDMPEEIKKVGKRGKDKAKRKKKVMSEAQLAALAIGRAKSLAKRKSKSKAKTVAKEEAVRQVNRDFDEPKAPKKTLPMPIPTMPLPIPHTKLDYDTFSSYMTKYEEKRKVKKNISNQPHPNKVINQIHRPQPSTSFPNPLPKQKPVTWKGTASVFAQYKKGGNSRWQYGI